MTDIFINEIYPNPVDGNEWIEIYNSTNENITTSRLKLYDQTGKYIRINKDLIQPKSYTIATASAVLNNSGDTVLLEKDGVVVETVSFGPIEQGKSYARCADIWIENILSTFALPNLCSEEDISITATLPPQNVIAATPTPSSTQQNPSSIYATSTQAKRVLPPIDFDAKHSLIAKATSPMPTHIILATPSVPSTSSAGITPLMAIAIVSFIQCVFLVYLIIKRIKFDTPTSSEHEND